MTSISFPNDIIITHILPKLPSKTLIIFKCVCKSWQTYISSPKFINIHLNISLTSNNNHLIILTNTHNSLFSLQLNTLHVPIKLKFPISFDDKRIIVGSCNGLVCVKDYGRNQPIWVLNPSIGFYREIPCLHLPRRPSAGSFGFGYDSVNDDYKIVRLLDYYAARGFLFRDVCRQVNVYSLKDSVWRTVEWVVAYDRVRDGDNGAILNNHLVHWVVWCFELGKCRIRCFDLCVENWVDDVPMLDIRVSNVVEENGLEKRDGVLDFGVFDGYLFMSLKNEEQCDQINVVFDLWIMKEYGVKESWIRLFCISDARVTRSLRMGPVVYSHGRSKVLVRREYKSEHKLCWYDVKDGFVEIAEFHGVGDCFWADHCIGSLVCVPGGNQFVMCKQHD